MPWKQVLILRYGVAADEEDGWPYRLRRCALVPGDREIVWRMVSGALVNDVK